MEISFSHFETRCVKISLVLFCIPKFEKIGLFICSLRLMTKFGKIIISAYMYMLTVLKLYITSPAYIIENEEVVTVLMFLKKTICINIKKDLVLK